MGGRGAKSRSSAGGGASSSSAGAGIGGSSQHMLDALENDTDGPARGSQQSITQDGTPSKEALAVIQAHEKQIRNLDHEEAIAIDREGRVLLTKTGSKNQVQFTAEDQPKLVDCIFTHNHPSGSSLSPEDIACLHSAKMRQIRAIGNQLPDGTRYLYTATRPKGGLEIGPWGRHYDKVLPMFQQAYFKVSGGDGQPKRQSLALKLQREKGISYEQAWDYAFVELSHKTNVRVAKVLGYKYSRKRVK